jgi:nucleotide-binding universal stress UspA family protein
MLIEMMVVIDDTDESEKALHIAKQFLAPWGTLCIVRVITRLDMADFLERFAYSNIGFEKAQRTIDDVVVAVERDLRRLILDYEGEAKHEIFAPIGEPEEEITKLALARNIQAIVLHEHVYKKLDRWLFGRTSTRIIKQSPCPVIVVTSAMDVDLSTTEIKRKRRG